MLAQSPVPAVPTRATQKAPPPPPEAFAARPDGDELVRITADRQEKSGHLYHLRGNVEIRLRDMRLTADEVDYDESSGDLDARGNVRFQREANQEDIHASKARYNLTTERGEFHQVRGTTGARPTGPETTVLTTTNPYYFEARRAEKVGDNTYILYDGMLTSCQPPAPIWSFTGSRAKIRPGEDVVIYNGFVKVRNKIPIFFSPIFYHSLKRIPRRSGFLTPNIGNSSRKGIVLGESFYWAINRSADAELGAEYYSKRGWAQRGTLRMRPHAGTNLTASYFGVVDRGLKLPDGSRLQQGGRTLLVTGTSELPRGFRAVADFNYLSSFQFRQAFTEATWKQLIRRSTAPHSFPTISGGSASTPDRSGSRISRVSRGVSPETVWKFEACPGWNSTAGSNRCSGRNRGVVDGRFMFPLTRPPKPSAVSSPGWCPAPRANGSRRGR